MKISAGPEDTERATMTTDGGSTWSEAAFGKWVKPHRVVNDSTVYASGKTVYKYSRNISTGVKDIAEKIEGNYKSTFAELS